MHNELEWRCLAVGGEEAGQGRPVPGTSLSLYNHSPLGYLPLGPHYWVALTKTPNRGVFYWWATFEDWGRAYTCPGVEICCHVQTLIDIRACCLCGRVDFNCLIIILHYRSGPITWLRVAFSASPHPLLPKWRHPRNSSRWWWRVNWEGLSCCRGYRHWYFCCPNKHLIKNQHSGVTKRWGNKQRRNVWIVMPTKPASFFFFCMFVNTTVHF